MDPALLRRFWTMAIEPTTEDWLNWAEGRDDIGEVMRDYIKNYPSSLRYTGELEPGKTYANPASWHRLGSSLKFAGYFPDDVAGKKLPDIFYPMATGFVGVEAAVSFTDFVRNYETSFSAEDVLDNWKSSKLKIDKITNDKKNDLIHKIIAYGTLNNLRVDQVLNASEFVKTCSDEMIVNFFNLVMETKDLDHIRKFHKTLGRLVTEIVNTSDKF
jgi:hypothetical protein